MKLTLYITIVCASVVLACSGGEPILPPAPIATTLSITPAISTAEAGATVQFVADVRDQFGAPMTATTVSWMSSSPGVASVSPSGVANAIAPGIAAISATVAGKSASATMTVIPPVIVSVTVGAVASALVANQVVQLTAEAKDRTGATLSDRAIAWSTNAPAVAYVDATGKLTAVGGGTATITATSEGVVGTTIVVVSGPPAVLPVINSISPAVLVPGTVMTITGSNFDATPTNTVVSVRGYNAPVVTVTPTKLTVTVPCVLSGPANVQVTAGLKRGLVFATTVEVPRRTLAVGQAIVLSDVACNELAPPQTTARYIISVFSAAQSENTLADFEISGNSSANGPLASTVPVAPVLAAPLLEAGPDAAHDKAHFAQLERNRAIFVEGQRLMARMPAMSRTATAAEVAAVGDTRRFFYTYTSGCSDTTARINAKAIYAGTKAIIWEDTTNSLVSSTDPALAGFYQRLGQIFDQDQFDVVKNNFGDPLRRDAQTDNDGHINMIFSERLNGSGAAAFVTGCDQYPPNVYRASNFGENFYGTVPTSRGSNLNSTAFPDGWFNFMGRTVVHEVKHIASQAARVANGAPSFEESWLEEGTARHAEELWVRQYIHKIQWKANTGFGAASTNGIYCDFHPENTTCNAADALRRPAYGMRRHFNEIRNKLLQPWTWSIYGDGSGQSGSVFYQTTWSLVRYVIDRHAVSDAAFFTALVNARTSGMANLSATAGVSADQLLGMWTLALYADDYPGLASPSADIQFPTWNLRNIYSGLNTDPNWSSSFPTAFPITPVALPMGAFSAQQTGVRGGANAYFELSGLTPFQLINIHSLAGGAPSPNLRLAIARLQ